MDKIEFNTQICTNKEQSKRLIDLGLNPNTSDMHHYRWSEGYWDIQNCPPRGSNSNFIPAWSLHRLYEMCPGCLFKLRFALNKIVIGDGIFYCTENNNVRLGQSFSQHCNLYDNIIDCIEWLIKNNHFNKDYLK